jgi:hypothetical protein
MNYSNEISSAFSNKPIFTRNELKDFIKTQNPMMKDSTFGWILYGLCQQHVIQRVAHDTFKIYDKDNSLKEYKADLSDDAGYILDFLKKQFPLLTFMIWETRAYNEFANHQMARNFIFVEVEKPLGESVFNALHEQKNYTTLYKPSVKEIALYSGDVTVSVLHLTSEAPINGFYTTLEKILVDLFANKLLDRIVSRSDYPEIFEEAFSKYSINYNLMVRYAKRRNKDAEIKTFIKEKTIITVYGKEKRHD